MKKTYISLAALIGLLLLGNIAKAAINSSNQPTTTDNTENFAVTNSPLSIIIIDDENYPAQPKKTAKKANPSVKKLSEKPIINDTISNQTARMVNYQIVEGDKYLKNT